MPPPLHHVQGVFIEAVNYRLHSGMQRFPRPTEADSARALQWPMQSRKLPTLGHLVASFHRHWGRIPRRPGTLLGTSRITPVTSRLASPATPRGRQRRASTPAGTITWEECQVLHTSCPSLSRPRTTHTAHAGSSRHDKGSVLPVRALRCGRPDLRIDLDPLPGAVCWTRSLRPNHRAGDL